MLQDVVIDGRKAVVAYLIERDGMFIPVDKDKATMVKIIYQDNGDRVFGILNPAQPVG